MSLASRKTHSPRPFQNRVLRKIFGPKRVEVLHNEELNDPYSSPDIIIVMK